MKILNNRMDKMMPEFEESNADFFQGTSMRRDDA